LCLRVCSLSGSHHQIRLTVPTKTHCCCFVLEQLSLVQKKSAGWLGLSIFKFNIFFNNRLF
jgi:hypothetical protein